MWPDLDAPCYADPAAAVERLALKGWRQGGMTPDAPLRHVSPAGQYLAADVTYFRTLLGQMPPLEAIAAYDRALRGAPDFPDAPRALLMIGFASLRLGLAPEADTAFARVLTEHPDDAHALIATLGRTAALRLRRRLDDAGALLATIPEPLPPAIACDVLAERAALARAAGRPADAVAADDALARRCPGFYELGATLADRAASLVAIGRRADARALLERDGDALEVDAEAEALVRAAELAREDGDLVAARRDLERALGLRVGPGTRVRVQARLARLDATVAADRALASLDALVASAPTQAVRLDVVGIAAETLADTGEFARALARLAAPDAGGAENEEATLVHRDAILARWIAERSRADDRVGVALVYARHRTAVDTRADATTIALVADALGRLRLDGPALRLLRLRDGDGDPARGLAVVEAALAAGEKATARDALERLADVPRRSELAARRARLAARLDAIDGRPERVPASAVAEDPALAADVASAWRARGAAALARESWDAAAEAYAHAETLAPDGTARLIATAGLVAARTGRDARAADPSVARLAAIDDPAVRRAVALVGETRGFGTTVAAPPAPEAPR